MADTLKDEHLVPLIAACENCPLLIQIREGRAKVQTMDEVWKWIATSLGGGLIGFCVFWFSGPVQAVTRAEMVGFIKDYSPYAQDRLMLTTTLGRMEQSQRDMAIDIKLLADKQVKLEQAFSIHTSQK